MEGRSSVVLNTHAQQDLLAYCTRPVSVHLVMACTGCSFNSFSVFLLSLKQQNLMKIMFSYIHFPVWPYPPKIMIFYVLYTGKLYGLTGWKLKGWERAIISKHCSCFTARGNAGKTYQYKTRFEMHGLFSKCPDHSWTGLCWFSCFTFLVLLGKTVLIFNHYWTGLLVN